MPGRFSKSGHTYLYIVIYISDSYSEMLQYLVCCRVHPIKEPKSGHIVEVACLINDTLLKILGMITMYKSKLGFILF